MFIIHDLINTSIHYSDILCFLYESIDKVKKTFKKTSYVLRKTIYAFADDLKFYVNCGTYNPYFQSPSDDIEIFKQNCLWMVVFPKGVIRFKSHLQLHVVLWFCFCID